MEYIEFVGYIEVKESFYNRIHPGVIHAVYKYVNGMCLINSPKENQHPFGWNIDSHTYNIPIKYPDGYGWNICDEDLKELIKHRNVIIKETSYHTDDQAQVKTILVTGKKLLTVND